MWMQMYEEVIKFQFEKHCNLGCNEFLIFVFKSSQALRKGVNIMS